jgi:hypothetical protein
VSKYTIDLGPEFEQTLTSLARERGTTKAEVIRRAVITYAALRNEEKMGYRVSIVGSRDDSGGDEILKDIILP